jgi:hypothetical protein
MSLLERARSERAQRAASERELDKSWDSRTAVTTARCVGHCLECEIDPAALTKIAGGNYRSLWRFELEGHSFLAGHYWERIPGPAGDALFLAIKTGRVLPWQRTNWPPPDEHGRDWTVPGYTRIHSLSGLADVLDPDQSIEAAA